MSKFFAVFRYFSYKLFKRYILPHSRFGSTQRRFVFIQVLQGWFASVRRSLPSSISNSVSHIDPISFLYFCPHLDSDHQFLLYCWLTSRSPGHCPLSIENNPQLLPIDVLYGLKWMGDRDRGSSHSVGRLNAAQKPLSNDTWCSTQRYSKLTNLFYFKMSCVKVAHKEEGTCLCVGSFYVVFEKCLGSFDWLCGASSMNACIIIFLRLRLQ